MRWLGIAGVCLVAGLSGFAGSSACTLPLRISCGDGFVDFEAGEECDPADPGSWQDACEGTSRPLGRAFCDPVTCELDVSIVACAVCGDGVADTIEEIGEECDGSDFAGQGCDGGVGALRCTSQCTLDRSACKACGNLQRDEGEECDFSVRIDDEIATDGLSCADLVSPYSDLPYSSGTYRSCDETCRWARIDCGYCGNDRIDRDRYLDLAGQVPAPDEVCDGDRIPSALFGDDETCEAVSEHLRSNLVCADDCSGLEPPEGPAPQCCVRAGAPCPDANSELQGYRCCWEFQHPDRVAAGESACDQQIAGTSVGLPVCRPVGGA